MITLTQAFRLCCIRDDEIVCLRKKNESFYFPSFYTGKEVREKYDMKHTKVREIRPRFSFGEYEGMEFIIN